jgi:hypothetical protein
LADELGGRAPEHGGSAGVDMDDTAGALDERRATGEGVEEVGELEDFGRHVQTAL